MWTKCRALAQVAEERVYPARNTDFPIRLGIIGRGSDVRHARDALSLDDALRLVQAYVEHYNNVRLNSAIGYVTPKDVLAGRQQEIHAERDRKLEAARQQRQSHRQQAA